VPEPELDLFKIPGALPAQLGARAAEVMGAEALDPNVLR
jgi:hypothetical protein